MCFHDCIWDEGSADHIIVWVQKNRREAVEVLSTKLSDGAQLARLIEPCRTPSFDLVTQPIGPYRIHVGVRVSGLRPVECLAERYSARSPIGLLTLRVMPRARSSSATPVWRINSALAERVGEFIHQVATLLLSPL